MGGGNMTSIVAKEEYREEYSEDGHLRFHRQLSTSCPTTRLTMEGLRTRILCRLTA